MYFIGIDLGSSSVKVSIMDATTGDLISSAYSPSVEMPIHAAKPGWAEQDPSMWWQHLKEALQMTLSNSSVKKNEIKAIGISYQMHGLVLVDKQQNVLRPSIIWCDSRAVDIGSKAFDKMGHERCLSHLLNSPGNFTASKLRWVKENEPALFEKIYKIMLPGDYLVMKLSGEINTTTTGLSEGIFWDFKKDITSPDLLAHFEFDGELIPDIVPTFGLQAEVSQEASSELGIPSGIPITYRAGDQPNNALSLNVLQPGEIAATAGTSGVVYGVSDQVSFDPKSRVNTFAHVNHTKDNKRLGILLCVNGTGILYNWLRRYFGKGQLSYEEMNNLAEQVPIGAEGLSFLPFGNGAERILENRNLGAHLNGLDFNRHTDGHLIRAAKEGIAFAFRYGMDIMKDMGVHTSVIRAGQANMFLSPTFRQTLSNVTDSSIELFNTDGSLGAARAAGVGLRYYNDFKEAFSGLKKVELIEPNKEELSQTSQAYNKWKSTLEKLIS